MTIENIGTLFGIPVELELHFLFEGSPERTVVVS